MKNTLKSVKKDCRQLSIFFPDSSPCFDQENYEERPLAPRRGSLSKAEHIPSLIKWTGSKRGLAKAITAVAPSHHRYFEPFLGGGAVLYAMSHHVCIAGDSYAPLMELWKIVQTDPELLVTDYQRQWEFLQADFPNYFYSIRERFNKKPNALDLNFLTRTCVNGIVRFNSKGRFNNSFHLSRRGMEPSRFAGIVRIWNQAIRRVQFLCADYQDTIQDTKAGDFVYLDPPYAGNKQRYAQNLDLERFFCALESLNSDRVYWALSFDGLRGNSDFTHNIPRELYRRHIFLNSGNSPVSKVLNGPIERVMESLYLNY